MNNSEFIEFFKSQLSNDSAIVVLETNFRDLPDWDSLTVMLIITNLKEDYGIEIGINDLQNCQTIGDLYTLIYPSE